MDDKTPLSLLFVDFTTWLQDHAVAIVIAVIGGTSAIVASLIKLAVSAGRMDSKVKSINDEVSELSHDFYSHRSDAGAHVNRPYMSALENEIKEFKATVYSQHSRMDEKLDDIIKEVYKK